MAGPTPLSRVRTRMRAVPLASPHAVGDPGEHHRDVRGGGLRAAVFGISDGLVSNVSLVLGTAGAHPAESLIRLAGLAGLFGGAFSMAAGEFISMQAQREAFEREIAIEREEIRRRPDFERRELARIYEGRGMERQVAEQLAAELMSDPEIALDTHAREELGIDPSELGSPVQAAASSFVTFAVGALIPLLPFLFGISRNTAVLVTVAVSAVAALGVGALLSLLTARQWWYSALRQLFFSALAGAVTFGIGSAIGAGAG